MLIRVPFSRSNEELECMMCLNRVDECSAALVFLAPDKLSEEMHLLSGNFKVSLPLCAVCRGLIRSQAELAHGV